MTGATFKPAFSRPVRAGQSTGCHPGDCWKTRVQPGVPLTVDTGELATRQRVLMECEQRALSH